MEGTGFPATRHPQAFRYENSIGRCTSMVTIQISKTMVVHDDKTEGAGGLS